jgi:hypothetical protein
VRRGRSAGWLLVLQKYRNPTSEDKPFEQRVRGQPIGAVHVLTSESDDDGGGFKRAMREQLQNTANLRM